MVLEYGMPHVHTHIMPRPLLTHHIRMKAMEKHLQYFFPSDVEKTVCDGHGVMWLIDHLYSLVKFLFM